MSTHKHIDRVCLAAALFSLLLALVFVNGEALGISSAGRVMGYEARLFDTSRVHTLEIVIDDWEGFLETCENEEYVPCAVVIDNEAFKNVGLRAKGNTSLNTVASLGSSRYSFKLEFDQYESGRSYYGLDKLCLNNVIQDNTYMKDYLTYRLMDQFGVSAPLCSYVYITVNGEDWGLYLAVEGVEDGFLQRNYGTQHGELYKPDSSDMGGGRGNGRDFNMGELDLSDLEASAPREAPEAQSESGGPAGGGEPHGGDAAAGRGDSGVSPGGGFQPPDMFGDRGFGMGGMNGGMGSDDVKLQYLDDDPDSYANIFENAKTEASTVDQARLIQALKALGEGDIDAAVDVDAVLRYFVVHNFVVNGDSYTGSIVHNYYLYEEDGLLSMIPWDYNLAFGTFQGSNASTAVNDPIDTPLSVTGGGDRPMADWIVSDEARTALYHQYFAEFLETADPAALIDEAYALIAPYVERDPTKFCTYEEFETGAEALKAFCALRAESVSGQLAGTIPSTSQGQSAGPAALVDASGLSLSDMGTMSQGGGFGGRGGPEGAASSFGGTPDDAAPAPGGTPEDAAGSPGGAPENPAHSSGELPEGSASSPGEAQDRFAPQPDEALSFPAGSGGTAPAENGGDRWPVQMERRGGGVGPPESTSAAPGSSNGWLLLGVSALVLLAGLLAAWKYRRS